MSAPIEIKTKEKTYQARVPTSWSEVTLEQFYKWAAWAEQKTNRDWIKFYEIFTGLPYEILAQVRVGSIIETLDAWLEFIFKNTKDAELHKYPVPEFLEMTIGLHKKSMRVPRQIEQKQLGQKYALQLAFEELREAHKNEPEYQLERAAMAIAVFMYQEITDSQDFNLEFAKTYIPRIKKLPADKAIPIAVFFWNSYMELRRHGANNSKPNQNPSKLQLELPD